MSERIYNGPRFGKDADPERNGTTVTVSPCQCITCRDMGAWLSESHHVVTFADGMSRGHVPARWLSADFPTCDECGVRVTQDGTAWVHVFGTTLPESCTR